MCVVKATLKSEIGVANGRKNELRIVLIGIMARLL
jgi:hypothetical protein